MSTPYAADLQERDTTTVDNHKSHLDVATVRSCHGIHSLQNREHQLLLECGGPDCIDAPHAPHVLLQRQVSKDDILLQTRCLQGTVS